MNNLKLKKFVEENPRLVTRKESTRYPGLFVLKYAKRVFYDNLWSESIILNECRGLVVDENYETVCRPFTKIFNYHEEGAGDSWKDDDTVLITKKINGFMAGLTKVKDQAIVSTTGSLDSEFVDMAKEYLDKIPLKSLAPYYTYMFEICHPNDPHIIEEVPGAHLLAIVEHDTGLTHYKFDKTDLMVATIADFKNIESIITSDDDDTYYSCKFGDVKKEVAKCRHEGFVIVNPLTDETLKIKSPYYLFKKFLARVSTDKLIMWIKSGEVKRRIEEEYYPVLENLNTYGLENFTELKEQERLDLLRGWIEQLQQ